MADTDLSIPTASISSGPKPYTIYHVRVQLSLRTVTLDKRYSEFRSLHERLVKEVGEAPPFKLPPKSFFTSSATSPALTETRRQGLEAYLRGIQSCKNASWRGSKAWRAFLNLSGQSASKLGSQESNYGSNGSNGSKRNEDIDDPVVWLETFRTIKTSLHEARLHLTRRDQAETTQAQHESSAQAKKCLAGISGTIDRLSDSLRKATISRLGEGEIRRRRDLLSNASRERDGLQNLITAMATKSALDGSIAGAMKKNRSAKTALLNDSNSHGASSVQKRGISQRVLGQETSRTRELDNSGVLQLQQQLMQEQDEDVTILAKAVARQKELGIKIQEELAVQGDMLNLLDEDTDRVQSKMDIARKRVDQIS